MQRIFDMSIKIIGITGPSGSGKSVLGEQLRLRGVPCIDADALYHELLVPPSECLNAIADAFGKNVIAEDGTLDRVALGKIVFSDPDKLKLLNGTVLSIVIKEIRRLINEYEQQGHTVIAVDAPTLIESGFDKECECVISVIADKDTRIQRISKRDGITREAAEARVSAQKPNEFYIKHSDTVIFNDSTEECFEQKIKAKIDEILQ